MNTKNSPQLWILVWDWRQLNWYNVSKVSWYWIPCMCLHDKFIWRLWFELHSKLQELLIKLMIGKTFFFFVILTIVFRSNLHVSLIYYSVCVTVESVDRSFRVVQRRKINKVQPETVTPNWSKVVDLKATFGGHI